MPSDRAEYDRGTIREAAEGALSLIAGSFGLAYFGGKLGALPPVLAQYDVLTRGAILAVVGLVFVTLFSITLGIALAHFLQWRYSHLSILREVRSDE